MNTGHNYPYTVTSSSPNNCITYSSPDTTGIVSNQNLITNGSQEQYEAYYMNLIEEARKQDANELVLNEICQAHHYNSNFSYNVPEVSPRLPALEELGYDIQKESYNANTDLEEFSDAKKRSLPIVVKKDKKEKKGKKKQAVSLAIPNELPPSPDSFDSEDFGNL